MKIILTLLLAAAPAMTTFADPQLTSWYTADSGQYARIYQSTAAETAGTASTTWSRGTGVQSSPTYAGVSKIVYSDNWVYIRTTGLAGHIMGPWYLDAAKTQNFPNFPSNTAKIYRIPRTPVIPATKTLTGLGATGCMVNGVSMFDSRDAFSYVSASATDATPVNGLTGDGVWNRDGYHNEGVTFDPALAHQAGNNYHYHAQPIGLRYQLGDHVDYNATTNRYTESTAPVTKHSPILAWAADGLPVYGPYGYSSPLDPNSGVRRMVSGFVLRNGSNGTTNLTTTGRTTLPAWAQRDPNRHLQERPGRQRHLRARPLHRGLRLPRRPRLHPWRGLRSQRTERPLVRHSGVSGRHLGLLHAHQCRRHARLSLHHRPPVLRQPDRRHHHHQRNRDHLLQRRT